MERGSRSYRLEGSNVAPKILRKVVYCHSAFTSIKESVRDLWDAFIGAITGAEVQVCCPVVRALNGQCFALAGGCFTKELTGPR